MRTFLITVVSVCLSLVSFAQRGKIEGKVIDSKTGAPLVGVTVKLKGTDEGVATNVEGRYVINANVPKATLVFSYNGVTQEVSDIPVEANKVTYQDLALEQKTKTEEAVVVRSTTTARKETAAALIAFQKNTNTVASVISSESIRRSPDKNTGEVLKRTPGASIQEGKFLVVRGLADRYNQAMLNGILLTSTEPDRKTFSFDLIPSQMIDNIIINKAFVPEYPGEWAGGLIQVNTKDIPSKNFFNIQLGTGFNTQTTGKTFYKDAQGGKYDWLGFDDGTRALPSGYTTKSNFDTSSRAAKIEIGKAMRNSWVPDQYNAPLNLNVQLNGGFTGKLMGKKIGGTLGVIYNKSNRYFDAVNRKNILNDNSEIFTIENDFSDARYVQEISAGAQAGLSMQLNSYNKVSIKSLLNVNTSNTVTLRTGKDVSRNDSLLMGTEFSFKENTFFTVQAIGEHRIVKPVQLKWYGSFNILDGYIPDQRRLLYSRVTTQDPWSAVIANSLSQQSGSRIYQSLSDYIYTAGGDLNFEFNAFGGKQNLKGGYMLQVKDRLYDAQLFANYLPVDNAALRALPAAEIFNAANFGTGYDNKFAFDAIKNRNFRYLANTILNAGFIQFDNQFTKNIRVVWGVRVEHYDQLVGSVKKYDPRFTNTKVLDWLPGLNATFKINSKTNIRLSGSQTVVRPELRELSFLNLYDFDLNASVQGKPTLKRTKVLNLDLRYEIYPRAGEVITAGVFYKYFKDPIEQIYNEGGGGASTFSFQNPDKARSYGVELEFRKKLDAFSALKHFTVQANASYINSRVTDTLFDIDRRLQGQSPYLINAGLLYDLDNGFNATLLFNVIGERIYLVGDKSAGAGTPDIYEAPRPLLDFQVSQKLFKKKGEVRLNVSDILNRTQYFYQNSDPEKDVHFQKNKDAYRFTRKFGTTFSLSFNYSF